MFDKIGALWRLFKASEIVANPTAWKRGQITVAALTTLLGAIVAAAKIFGYDLPVTDEQIGSIAAGVLAVVGVFNQWTTAATTDRIDALGRKTVQRVPDTTGQAEISDHAGPATQPVPRESQAAPVTSRTIVPQDPFSGPNGG